MDRMSPSEGEDSGSIPDEGTTNKKRIAKAILFLFVLLDRTVAAPRVGRSGKPRVSQMGVGVLRMVRFLMRGDFDSS
jgi:hypothetical protein